MRNEEAYRRKRPPQRYTGGHVLPGGAQIHQLSGQGLTCRRGPWEPGRTDMEDRDVRGDGPMVRRLLAGLAWASE